MAHHHAAEVVDRRRLGPHDHVVGAGDVLGGDHAVDAAHLLRDVAALPTSVWMSTYAVTAMVVPSLEPARGSSGPVAMVVVTGPWPPGRSLARWQVEGVRRRPASRASCAMPLADLLDQRTPFGRLALTQVVLTAGDTLLTVSLAVAVLLDLDRTRPRAR